MKFNLQTVKDFARRHPILTNLAAIIVAGLILLWLVLIFLDFWTMHGSTAVVPEIKQKSYNEARALLAANGLSIEISDSIYDRSTVPGTVVESWPKAGAVVKSDRAVYVTITAFSPKQVSISMPLTGNVSSRQALSYLRGIGITDVQMVYVPSEYADLVVGARYGDTPLTVGSVIPVTSTVTLEVGNGPAPADTDSTAVEEPYIFDESAEIYE